MPGPPPPLPRLVRPDFAAPAAGVPIAGASGLISRHSPAAQRAGRSLRAKIIIFSFELGQWLRGRVEEHVRRREYEERKTREEWRLHMMRTVWADVLMTHLPRIAGNAFDQLVGARASTGVVPVLTDEAIKAEHQLLHEISDQWREDMRQLERLELILGSIEREKPPRPFHEERRRNIVGEIEALQAKMQADMDAVVAHDCNPANWKLTSGQIALLPAEWRARFERRNQLEAAAAAAGVPASAYPGMAELKAEMAAEAGKLYAENADREVFGPEGPLADEAAADPPQYGPRP